MFIKASYEYERSVLDNEAFPLVWVKWRVLRTKKPKYFGTKTSE
jgi:hypothetical protein